VTGKVDPNALIAFVGEQERVTAAEVAARFGTSKNTARAALDSTNGIDSFEGVRGTRFYTAGTRQTAGDDDPTESRCSRRRNES